MDPLDALRHIVGCVYLDAGEELDVNGVSALERRIQSAFDRTSGEVILVCSALRFIDSSGLRLLLEMEREARLRGVRLVVGDPSEPLRSLLALTGLMNVLDVDDRPRRAVFPGTPLGGFPIASLVSS